MRAEHVDMKLGDELREFARQIEVHRLVGQLVLAAQNAGQRRGDDHARMLVLRLPVVASGTFQSIRARVETEIVREPVCEHA